MSFRVFDVETSDHCNLDYVEVHEESAGGRLLGHFCGSDIPGNLTASHRLWVKFRSDAEGTAAGFIADYALMHGNELYGMEGEITSPLYPLMYHRREQTSFTWLVTSPQGTHIVVTFTEFDVELHPVYDGSDATAPWLAGYCGQVRPRPVTSTGNVVFVRFESNPRYEGSRFRLSWEARYERAPADNQPRQVDQCRQRLFVNETGVVIQNPGFPEGYNTSLRCEWILTADAQSKIALTLETVDLESTSWCFDAIRVFDETLLGQQRLLGTYCKRSEEGKVITSAGNYMRVQFTSDASVNRTGFSARAQANCGGQLFVERGVITSPRYPEDYPAGVTCEWVVGVRPGNTIRVTFTDFQVASQGSSCTEDYIVLRNGDSIDSPYLDEGKYCGSSLPVVRQETTSNVLHVRFVSDTYGQAKVRAGAAGSRCFAGRGCRMGWGFKLEFQEVGGQCGGTFHLTNAMPEFVFSTPNFPNPPNAYTECECTFEYLELRDGGTRNSHSMDKLCASTLPDTQRSSGNALYVRYQTRLQYPRPGFKAKASIALCGGRMTATEGLIISPNYPLKYPDNVECEWRVRGLDEHYLQFTFLDLRLPQRSNCSVTDHVAFYDYNASAPLEGNLVDRVCGMVIPATIDMSWSSAIVRFRSDEVSAPSYGTGFRIKFNSSYEEFLPGILSSLLPSLSSSLPPFLSSSLPLFFSSLPPSLLLFLPPSLSSSLSSSLPLFLSGYPNNYPPDMDCVWAVEVMEGHQIQIHNGMWMEYTYQALLPTVTACGSTPPDPVSSSGPYMIVYYRTSGNPGRRGFRARYTTDLPLECGGDLEEETGHVTSPGFESGGYNRTWECLWTYSRPDLPGSTMRLTVNALYLEDTSQPGYCVYDALEIREGATEEGFMYEQLCGNVTDHRSVYIPGPQFWMRFKADSGDHHLGFNVTYRRIPCGGVLAGSTQFTVASPGYPNNYPPDMDCVWAVEVMEGHQIQVEFTDFALEAAGTGGNCTGDFLAMKNGRYPDSPDLFSVCGTQSHPTFKTQTNHLTVRFHSNSLNQAKGFSIRLTPVQRGCGGIHQEETGSINSPGYLNDTNYQANMDCVWEIRFENGYHVELKFVERFDIEMSANCNNDYVEVFSFVDGDWVSEARFCGRENPGTVKSKSSWMRVKFQSNGEIDGDGFKAEWKRACGGTYTEVQGIITSPSFPDNYGNNLDCLYNITGTPDSYIVLSFNPDGFSLEDEPTCNFDNVTVTAVNRDGSRTRVLNPACGTYAPQRVAARGALLVRFRTDESIVYRGFEANYSMEDCGGLVTREGVLKSPLHPLSYLHSINCTWVIQAPNDRAVQIKFEALDIEYHHQCKFDYVAVYEGDGISNATLQGKYCGVYNETIQGLPTVKSHSSQMVLEWKTDQSVSRTGFRAVVSFEIGPRQGCGGLIEVGGEPMRIISPDTDSDGQYEKNLDCRWVLDGDPNRILQIQFNSFNLQDSPDCSRDYIQVNEKQMGQKLKGFDAHEH
ncbi:unnamed protein product [Darwinula stevensoni]|uniref:CUB domain-containing protein n=1 Tax=Darwinula stevensoni TaxID=69355 RepID=A0A7R9A3T7_9CRUS|nr:unnamed protein product [Darwinula stevensoni]CAG0888619.1 unnamed protein product [Darwinula stevensoni]